MCEADPTVEWCERISWSFKSSVHTVRCYKCPMNEDSSYHHVWQNVSTKIVLCYYIYVLRGDGDVLTWWMNDHRDVLRALVVAENNELDAVCHYSIIAWTRYSAREVWKNLKWGAVCSLIALQVEKSWESRVMVRIICTHLTSPSSHGCAYYSIYVCVIHFNWWGARKCWPHSLFCTGR